MLTQEKTQRAKESLSKTAFESHFLSVRKLTETLCGPLSDEDSMLSVTKDTSPPKWHLAHTSWFFEHFILFCHSKDFARFDSRFDYLFNSYYNGVGKHLLKSKRNLISQPSQKQVLQYRDYVTEKIYEMIENADEREFNTLYPLIELGIHHEQQHQELLLMDIKRNFFAHPFHPTFLAPLLKSAHPQTSPSHRKQLSFRGGLTEIGSESTEFHYDNEGARHSVWIEPFHLASNLVTQGDFLEFIESGGYHNSSHWLSDGWDLVQKYKWEAPLYWNKTDSGYEITTLRGVEPLNESDPVSHVSYYEAQAYAHFKDSRLPTEFEWEYAASFERMEGGFLEDGSFHPKPFPGFHGGLWEWTQSAYLPYPGYKPFDGILSEYNAKFMCNQFVMRGGSCVTPRVHYRLSYRNFYYPHMRWQFSGFRLAKDGL